ncbi:MAG: glycosyltransferase N-terminal domain-containing protein, partial [Pseudomonadota bacterium]
YSKFRWLFQPLVENFKLLMVRHADDARYLISLGAGPERVQILGNIKFDGLLEQAQETLEIKIRQRLCFEEGRPVLVAGSTRGGEEAILLAVYNRLKASFPDLALIEAPRHINRVAEIETWLQKQGVSYELYSRLFQSGRERKEAVILIDRIGDLFALYSLATVVFCGASLVPKGGQNILEPAAWGKMVFYGPHMEDFKDARHLLEDTGAGIQVRDEEDLVRQMGYFLEHPEERVKRGEAGRQALKSQIGLTRKAAEMIAEVIKNN